MSFFSSRLRNTLALPRPPKDEHHRRATANPSLSLAACWRGTGKNGADQVPMTCIHDCHLHAATLIRRTYIEFGDATGSPAPCLSGRPLSWLPSPQRTRSIVARLAIWQEGNSTGRITIPGRRGSWSMLSMLLSLSLSRAAFVVNTVVDVSTVVVIAVKVVDEVVVNHRGLAVILSSTTGLSWSGTQIKIGIQRLG